jgi:hypothetical protein
MARTVIFLDFFSKWKVIIGHFLTIFFSSVEDFCGILKARITTYLGVPGPPK